MSGENHPLFGKLHFAETKAKISLANKGMSNLMFSQSHSEKTKLALSIAKKGGTIFVYDTNGSLVNSFCSTRKAAEFFNCTHPTIKKHYSNGKLYKKLWIFSTVLK
jgi:group I intron endonuclease